MSEPLRIASHAGLTLCFEGFLFWTDRISRMVRGDRYADIYGRHAGAALSKVGWHYSGRPVCFTAIDADGEVAGVGWCSPVKADNGQYGCNLSYAVAPSHEGKGLAKILSSLAFLGLWQSNQESGIAFVNIQCRKDNLPAVGVARSFGFDEHVNGHFQITPDRGLEPIAYLGYRREPQAFHQAARETLRTCGLDDLLALIDAAAPEQAEIPAMI